MSRAGCKEQLVKFVQQIQRLITGSLISDHEDEDQDGTVVRHRRPEGLERLHSQSHFTKRELQTLYWGFKTECPSGTVDEDTFRGIYGQFFPGGDVSKYAHLLFLAFDTEQNGCVDFEDFVRTLSVLLRGSPEEKLQWTFNLYDLNKDGHITKEEMLVVMKAIYEITGKNIHPPEAPRQHTEIFFQKMDQNRDGVVTIEEFLDSCQKDEDLMKSMRIFENTN